MSDRKNGLFQRIKARKGMTLVEVLVALALLSLIILVFTPLFMNYYRNIRTAGDITRTTYKRTSLMERLVANAGNANDTGYETHVSNVPIILKNANNQSISVSFPLSDRDNVVEGNIISENNNTPNSYATFYTRPLSNGMVCFPAQLTDDFIKKDIVVVPKGFNFNSKAYNKLETGAYNFKVYNTDSSGVQQLVGTNYYDIRATDQGTATFTFYGGNDVISFEHSPLWIAYCDGDNAEYRVKVEISAPEIILVGEKPVGKNDYYYYATAGVDLSTDHYGEMDIVAKKMSGAPLTSAMNDVEWVEKGRGDDGNGNINKYGYYIMGGDAGQVRRFWRNETTGNYYWGGDYLNNYDRYVYLKSDGNLNEGHETFNRSYTTQANFKSVFRSDANKVKSSKTGTTVNSLFASGLISIFDYYSITTNYFTANVNNNDTYYMTIGNVINAKWKTNIFSGVTNRQSNGASSNIDFNGVAQQQWTWFTGDNTQNTKLNVTGYKEATGYEYPSDNSLITITSVGAIQIDKSNTNYYPTQGNSTVTNNVYPTQSYTLYCGYIPAVIDTFGYKTSTVYWKGCAHTGTYGAAYSSITKKFYPTGKFGDIYTTSTALDSSIMGNLNYTSLLCWKNDNNFPSAPSSNPSAGKYTINKWEAGSPENPGLLLPAEANSYYSTGGREVEVTMGYLSEPFAISILDPTVPAISRTTHSDTYLKTFNGGSDYSHSFFSGGLRDNVTLLDIKSFHDDISGNNISMGVGYTLSYILADINYLTRIQQIYNTGIVYIRSTGDGENNDTVGSLESGKGWSLAKETNVFHQFYGTDQFSSGSTVAANGWDTNYHRTYLNISDKDSEFPSASHSPNITEGNSSYGTNCHPMTDTRCTTVNWGTTWDEKPQSMWGTANGTVISWFYNYEEKEKSKITSVIKEFENYRWADRIGSNARQNQFYDYNSVKAGNQNTYGFVSVLSSINDVAFSDGIWVAVGNQAVISEYGKENESLNEKKPSDYCASTACYTQDGSAGSYVNVKYKNEHGVTQWKAVRISSDKNVNICSVVNCQGVWYIMGYVDKDRDGKNDANEPCVMFFSTHPEQEWTRCRTRKADGTYTAANSNNLSDTQSFAVYFDNGSVNEMELSGINKMASQG